MENVKDFVELPKSIAEEQRYTSFVSAVRNEIERIPQTKRKELLVDLITYTASLAELYYSEANQGKTKKRLVLEALQGVDTNENIERFLEVVLQNNSVVRKTVYKRLKLWFLKKFPVTHKK
jgi:hypothetical protein